MSDNDNDVNVKFGATFEDFTSGLSQVLGTFNSFSGELKGKLNELATVTKATSKLLGAVFATGTAVAGFKAAIDATVRMSNEQVNLSQKLGISQREAAYLAEALSDVHATTGQYEQALKMLQRQVRTNEGELAAMGLVARKVNGEFKDGQTLMQDAIDLLLQYKEGTDRNLASQRLFGRNAGDINNLLRLNKDVLADAREEIDQYGLYLGTSVAAVEQYKTAQEQLGSVMEAIKIKFGVALIPIVTEFTNLLVGVAVPAMTLLSAAFRTLAAFIVALLNLWDSLKTMMFGLIDTIILAGEAWGTFLSAMLHGDFKGAKAALNKGMEDIRNNFNVNMDILIEDAVKRGKQFADLMSDNLTGGKQVNILGTGTKSFVDPGSNKKANEDAAKEAQKLEDERLRLLKEAAEEKYQLAKISIQREADLGMQGLEMEKERIRLAREMQTVSDEQLMQEEQALMQKQYDLKREALLQEAQLNEERVIEHKQTMVEIEKLDAEHALNLARNQNDILISLKQKWTGLLSVISSAFSQSIKGIIAGTTTLKQAMANIFQSILLSFLDMLITMFTQWVAKQIAMAILGKAKAMAEITGYAGVAGAAATASAAAIPVTGWAIAPAAGAAAFAAAMSYMGAGLISAEGGAWEIPGDTLAMVHANEMVLPKELAQGLRNTVMSGSNNNGPTELHIHAVDGESVERLFRNNGEALVKVLKSQVRDFNRGNT